MISTFRISDIANLNVDINNLNCFVNNYRQLLTSTIGNADISNLNC